MCQQLRSRVEWEVAFGCERAREREKDKERERERERERGKGYDQRVFCGLREKKIGAHPSWGGGNACVRVWTDVTELAFVRGCEDTE